MKTGVADSPLCVPTKTEFMVKLTTPAEYSCLINKQKKTTLESILFLFLEEAESWDDNVSEEDQDEINF